VQAEEIERGLTTVLERAPEPIAAAYLFGSVARGTAGEDSDVDVAVLYAADPPSTLEARPFRLEAELERGLGRVVQVVLLNDAPVDLVHRVLRDGRLVLERDRSARIRFEVRARAAYFDLLPILLRYRRLDGRAA
jgi:predicted nucleotidyltransferase